MGALCLSLFWYVLLCVLSSFAIILKRKGERVALLLLSYGCPVTVNGLWFFLTVPWVCLQCVIVAVLDHTNSLSYYIQSIEIQENIEKGYISRVKV